MSRSRAPVIAYEMRSEPGTIAFDELEGGKLYLAMELVEGERLDLTPGAGSLKERMERLWLASCLVANMHELDTIHRIGSSRWVTPRLLGAELALVVAAAVILSAGLLFGVQAAGETIARALVLA